MGVNQFLILVNIEHFRSQSDINREVKFYVSLKALYVREITQNVALIKAHMQTSLMDFLLKVSC